MFLEKKSKIKKERTCIMRSLLYIHRGCSCLLEGVISEKRFPDPEWQTLRGFAAFHEEHIVATIKVPEKVVSVLSEGDTLFLVCAAIIVFSDSERLQNDFPIPARVCRVYSYAVATHMRTNSASIERVHHRIVRVSRPWFCPPHGECLFLLCEYWKTEEEIYQSGD